MPVEEVAMALVTEFDMLADLNRRQFGKLLEWLDLGRDGYCSWFDFDCFTRCAVLL